MTPEGKVKDAIKKLLKNYGIYYFMPRGSTFGRQGVADFVCCINGKFLSIEAKADSHSKQTAMQKYDESLVRNAGGTYIVVHKDNLSELESVLSYAKTERQNSSV